MLKQFKHLMAGLSLVMLLQLVLATALTAQTATAGNVEAGLYDMGKMWTFDYPPKDFFKTTYGFEADDKWFEEVRLASLRFASYCTASFVSADGLVMTNHHCARESGTEVQKEGEDFDKNFFYAKKLTDERKVEGLYVDQLLRIDDITGKVSSAMAQGKDDAEQIRMRNDAYENIKAEYGAKSDWQGLELEVVSFYNGGKYAIYGFKRYNDVRLVFMPETQLGFYGGDPDNFTYPRYSLDCSFFRVYDETGKPMKTDHYFKFNPNGVKEDEPVFVVGNPGSTERLSTVAELELKRDLDLPVMLFRYRHLADFLAELNKTLKNENLQNSIFSIENGHKALTGELNALKDPYMIARKAAFERKFKTDAKDKNLVKGSEYWTDIADGVMEQRSLFLDNSSFSPNSDQTGQMLEFANLAVQYAEALKSNDQKKADKLKEGLDKTQSPGFMPIEQGLLTIHLEEVLAFFPTNDPYIGAALKGKTPAAAAEALLKETKLTDADFRKKLIAGGADAILNSTDPMMKLAHISGPRYLKASTRYDEIEDKQSVTRGKLGRLLFDTYGTAIPPDATFTIRINDGIVKGYDYNGTKAPYKTTFFGMYDRNYSFDNTAPWNLPERWMNPSMELLKAPFTIVTTNDIIGGNSGSPMINKNREAVALIFDGNMESLSSGFIYVPDRNRAIAVHAGGITAALTHIYKAKRLSTELLGK